MRLSRIEQKQISAVVHKYDPAAEIWLYGSRGDASLKGGDIDLLVISETIDFSTKIDILVELKLAIGDQKIDLLIASDEDRRNDPFVASIFPKAIKLPHL